MTGYLFVHLFDDSERLVGGVVVLFVVQILCHEACAYHPDGVGDGVADDA